MSSPDLTTAAYLSPTGEFARDMSYITTRITADGRDGYPVEPGRYRLVVAGPALGRTGRSSCAGCSVWRTSSPWASAGPTHDCSSWTFDLDPGGAIRYSASHASPGRLLQARLPGYPRGITVPAIVDVPTGEVVTNDFAQITLDFSTEWPPTTAPAPPSFTRRPCGQRSTRSASCVYYRGQQRRVPLRLRRLAARLRPRPTSRLFARLDWLSRPPRRQRYLVGDTITEADVRLFTTLARFDPVYHGHFKCNRNKLTEMPVLWAYARDLFQTPGFGDTIDFVQIKRHYYMVHPDINPTGIVPSDPTSPAGSSPTDARLLGGRPFGYGDAARPAPLRPRSCRRSTIRSPPSR